MGRGLVVWLLCVLCCESTFAEVNAANTTALKIEDVLSSPYYTHPSSPGSAIAPLLASILPPPTLRLLESRLKSWLQELQNGDKPVGEVVLSLIKPMLSEEGGEEVSSLIQLTKTGTGSGSLLRSVLTKLTTSDTHQSFSQLSKMVEDTRVMYPSLLPTPPSTGPTMTDPSHVGGVVSQPSGVAVVQPSHVIPYVITPDASRATHLSLSSTAGGGDDDAAAAASQPPADDCVVCNDPTCNYTNMARIAVRWMLISLSLLIMVYSYLDDRTKCVSAFDIFATGAATMTEVSDIGLDYVGPADPAVGAQVLGLLVTLLAVFLQLKEITSGGQSPYEKYGQGDKLWAVFDRTWCPAIDEHGLGMTITHIEGENSTSPFSKRSTSGIPVPVANKRYPDGLYPVYVRGVKKTIRSVTKMCDVKGTRQDGEVKIRDSGVHERPIPKLEPETSTSTPDSNKVKNLNKNAPEPMIIVEWAETQPGIPGEYRRGTGGPGSVGNVENELKNTKAGSVTDVITSLAKYAVYKDPRLLDNAPEDLKLQLGGITESDKVKALMDCSYDCPIGVPAVERVLPYHELCIEEKSIAPQCGYLMPENFATNMPIVRVGTKVQLKYIHAADVYYSRNLKVVASHSYNFIQNPGLDNDETISRQGTVVELMAKNYDHEYLIQVPGTIKKLGQDKSVPCHYYLRLPIDDIYESGLTTRDNRQTIVQLALMLTIGGIMLIVVPTVTQMTGVAWTYMPLMGLYGGLLGYSFAFVLRSRDYDCRESWNLKGRSAADFMSKSPIRTSIIFIAIFVVAGCVFTHSH